MPTKPKNSSTEPGRDQCQTPWYAVKPLLPYLPARSTIWEPATGKGNIAFYLRTKGYSVVEGDLRTGQDFFSPASEPKAWDILVTNPPFSIKYKWLERCYQLGKPFALLMPVDVLGAWGGQKWFRKYGFEWMFFNRRVNYDMPNKGWSGAGSQFSSAWFCWKLLPKQVMFVDIPIVKTGQLMLLDV